MGMLVDLAARRLAKLGRERTVLYCSLHEGGAPVAVLRVTVDLDAVERIASEMHHAGVREVRHPGLAFSLTPIAEMPAHEPPER
jgi:hypothetical protein